MLCLFISDNFYIKLRNDVKIHFTNAMEVTQLK